MERRWPAHHHTHQIQEQNTRFSSFLLYMVWPLEKMLVFKWNLFPLTPSKTLDLITVWYEKVPAKTHLWQTSEIRKEHFLYTLCVAGSYLRKHLTWVLPHWQSQNVASHQAPATRKLTVAFICSSATAQNLQKKDKVSLPLPNRNISIAESLLQQLLIWVQLCWK